MKYLKRFTNAQEAQTVLATWPFNTIFSIQGQEGAHFSEGVAPSPAHDYVEIGGVKWATMNVGASTIYDPGLYFQWGDTQGYTADQVYPNGQKHFAENDYKWYDTELEEYTKYNENDGKTSLEHEDDPVTAAWGGNWRLPTTEELEIFNTGEQQEYVQNYQGSGVNGYIITDAEDSSKFIFIPDCNTFGLWGSCYFWGKNIAYSPDGGECVSNSEGANLYNIGMDRFHGAPVRGVLDE